MKKFVLNIVLVHCSYTIFSSKFGPYIKVRHPSNEVNWHKETFLSELANFSASDQLERNFPTVQNGLEKGKTLFIILVSK